MILGGRQAPHVERRADGCTSWPKQAGERPETGVTLRELKPRRRHEQGGYNEAPV